MAPDATIDFGCPVNATMVGAPVPFAVLGTSRVTNVFGMLVSVPSPYVVVLVFSASRLGKPVATIGWLPVRQSCGKHMRQNLPHPKRSRICFHWRCELSVVVHELAASPTKVLR